MMSERDKPDPSETYVLEETIVTKTKTLEDLAEEAAGAGQAGEEELAEDQ